MGQALGSMTSRNPTPNKGIESKMAASDVELGLSTLNDLTSISFSKEAGGRLTLSLYVFLHNASAGPRGPRGTCPQPPRRGRECPIKLSRE